MAESSHSLPRIKSVIESINLTRQEEIASRDGDQRGFADELLKKIDRDSQRHEFDRAVKVMFLSQPDDVETIKLPRPIINDQKDKTRATDAIHIRSAAVRNPRVAEESAQDQ